MVKFKRDPYSIDVVLLYAQRGHGKRSSFYSDYTFGVWNGYLKNRELVTVGKAYSGFTDQELLKLDKFIRAIRLDAPCHLTIEGNEKEYNLWLFEKDFGNFKKGECFILSYN